MNHDPDSPEGYCWELNAEEFVFELDVGFGCEDAIDYDLQHAVNHGAS